MTSPRFSPVPSDFGGRALSPTLSASSRTTTSFPTDMSDLSSLDGDEDFELVDAPRSERGEITDDDEDVLGNELTESFDDLANRGSTFSASGMMNRSVGVSSIQSSQFGEWNNTADQELLTRGGLDDSEILPSRNSLTTLKNSDLINSSTSSSLLRFPDPLDSSFQQVTDPDSTFIQEKVPERYSPSSGGNADDENEMEDRTTLTDAVGADASSLHSTEETPLQPSVEFPIEKNEAVVIPSPPTIPTPPAGFPFKIDRTLLASKAFRAMVSLLVVLLASGVMPVWRTNPPALLNNRANLSKLATNTEQPTTTPFAQLNKSLSVISSKASKGLIVVGKASPFSGSAKCSPGVLVTTTRDAASVKRKAKQSAARQISKDLTLAKKGNSEIMVFQTDTTYSSKAAEWFLSTPAKVSTVDVSHLKHTSAFYLTKIDPLARIQRPSRAAKTLMNGLHKQWSTLFDGITGDTLATFSAAVSKEAKMIQTEAANVWKEFHPRSKQMMNALQKTWEAWTLEMMKAYVKMSMIFHDEMEKLQIDLGKSYRKAYRKLTKFGKEVHRFTESSKQNANHFLRQAKPNAKLNEAFIQLIELQHASMNFHHYPAKLSAKAKEAYDKLKAIASTYKLAKPGAKGGKRDFKTTLHRHKKRSEHQMKRSMKAFRRTQKRAMHAWHGKRK
ncbi:uncharacterized protein FA14DRAFT_179881 [Meira miltonrushii]|uniref:Uncharacterized protein n=1 Tax=Meira miltonrushii TaxID=1280837 RepID=A0A316V6S8_9BASI|nr:uncharacterized protein FA14DRAFT_179881 [Meira miltonrushii]PWN33226.1 hypothetical protein FA14DRAFT_179881 [Meira miltonrushii]